MIDDIQEARSSSLFPRVTLPGLTAEDREAVSFVQTLLGEGEAQRRHVRAQQKGMAEAMLRLGKPVFRRGKPKRRKVTAHVRHMAAMRVRSTKAVVS